MRVPWMADVLRNAGLTVIETKGWLGRGKEMDAVEGVVMHHTASPRTSSLQTNLYVVTNGNGVGPGPIAQVLIWRDGSCYLIADGKANHAGAGGPWGWLPLSPPGQLSTANARTVGFECANDGVGEPWPAAQVIAMEIAAAAVLRHIGQGAERCLMHSEWAPTRKIDPAGPNGRIALNPGSLTWAGYSFRDRVDDWLTPDVPTPPPTPTPSEDVRMFIIVGNNDNRTDPRRWVWDGAIGMRLLTEQSYNDLVSRASVGLCKLHPAFASLSEPFWMSTAERSMYGAS